MGKHYCSYRHKICVCSCFPCSLLCGCLVLEFITVVSLTVCAVVLEVGSSVFVAQSRFLCGFDLSDH